MAHHRPWYKRNGGAIVMATLGMPDAETKWAYSAIIDMLNDRDRPLSDDAGFICGFTGLSRKKWSIVRRYLLETPSSSGEPFLILTDRGDLTNPRFERERRERRQQHEEAVEHGRAGGRKSAAMRAAGQTEFDLERDAEPPARAPARTDKSRKSAESESESTPESDSDSGVDRSAKPKAAPRKSKDLGQPPPQAPCARKTPEDRVKDSPHPDSADVTRATPDRLNDRDLKDLVDATCEAAGYRPVSPAQIDRSYRIVEEWRDAGFNFDDVVIPCIKAVVAETGDPTRTLGRFSARIRHEHARRKAKGEAGRPYVPPESPILDIAEEAPIFGDVRKALLERMGPSAYVRWCNRVRFEDVPEAGAGRRPMRVHDSNPGSPLVDADRATIVRTVARAHGFTDVWA